MQTISLQAVPSQSVTVTLNNQKVSLNVYAKTAVFDPDYAPNGQTILFCDVLLNDALVVGGVPCWNGNRIVRDTYLGFSGDLAFYDTLASDDPQYTGLDARWQLVYLTPADLATYGLAG